MQPETPAESPREALPEESAASLAATETASATPSVSASASASRRANRSARPTSKRLFGKKMVITSALAAGALAVGSGFVVQSSINDAELAAATAASTAATSQQLASTVAKSKAVAAAQNTIARADQVVADAQTKVDTAPLTASLASLNNYSSLDTETVTGLTVQTEFQAQNARAAAQEADRVAAEAAAAAAAQAAAEQAAAAQALADKIAAGNTIDGAKDTARSLASSEYGWGSDQFSCLSSLWQKESGWSYQAMNGSSGAAGIPQALPGSKMASVGSDWQTNAATQIAWGLKYIASSYGTPCSAWSHSQSVNWY